MYATAATRILAAHWNRKLPVDPVLIARAVGIKVYAAPLTDCSGKFEDLPNGPAITFSSSEPKVRQRFTVAHELGHWALKHGPNWRDKVSDFSIDVKRSVEREANKFAAELLMPAEAIKLAVEKHGITDFPELARIFGVSQVAMQYRLRNLGYV